MKMLQSCLIRILLLWCISSFGSASTSNNQSDRLGLLAFRDKINEDPLGALSSWNESLHHCEWHGVTCSRRHRYRVVVLDLDSQKLQGTLSPHIGNLSFLRRFILTMNSFHGVIPQEIGRLSRLRVLSLNNNSFNGEIPTNLTHCSNLRWINLADNKLTGRIPTELSSLSKLKVMALGINRLTGTIPASLGNLSALTDLSLSESSLEGNIPRELCLIQDLEFLNLSWDNLTGIVPSCLYNLSRITIFALASNQLGGSLPLDIGLTLPNLERLHLGRNGFSGAIPNTLSNASRLELIGLESNNLIGQVPKDLGRLQHLRRIYFNSNQLGDNLNFITSLTNCSNLERLSVSNNMLRGSLASIANLSTQISYLLLGENQIHGNIPAAVENLVNLNVLYASENDLSGGIPTSIGRLKNLIQLLIDQNRISGHIPSSLGNLSELTHLDLSGNQLIGSIPPSLGNCQNLFQLDVSYNKLNGSIPKQVIGLSSIKTALVLSHNVLSGSLPIEVGNLTSLQMLDVSANKLTGYIPATLGKCLTLEKLDLKNNFFQGTIPESLSTLKGVHYLDLSQNKFSGPIPDFLERFPLLAYLNLSFNELEGSVPKNGVFGNSSAFSITGNRKICGGLVELKLPPCHSQTSKQGKYLILKVVFPVIVVSLLLLLILWFLFSRLLRRKATKKASSASFSDQQLLRISYADLLKGTNMFSINNLIGIGSYGSVYKGILDKIGLVVAVKVINLQQRGALKSFFSECNALRNIRHRNLLKIITTCSSVDFQGNDFKALVFEFMPMGSLDEWLHPKVDEQLEPRSLNFLQRLNIAIDIACALDYLHHLCQPAIIHCDLKPSNVLLNEDMTAHVADFGLAKNFLESDSAQGQASANTILRGSIGYVAPEYGMGGEVSMQGDVYSYGILLLEMFTGKRPTNELFVNGLNIHNFVKMALPEQVMSILDPRMFFAECDESIDICNQCDKVWEPLVSVMKLGVACSIESPILERMNMRSILAELYHIRADVSQTRRGPEISNRMMQDFHQSDVISEVGE